MGEGEGEAPHLIKKEPDEFPSTLGPISVSPTLASKTTTTVSSPESTSSGGGEGMGGAVGEGGKDLSSVGGVSRQLFGASVAPGKSDGGPVLTSERNRVLMCSQQESEASGYNYFSKTFLSAIKPS